MPPIPRKPLEHLQSDPYLVFVERAFPSDLVPNRDAGVELFGDVFNGALSYAAAFTNGTGDNNTNTSQAAPVTSGTDNNDGKEGTGRLVVKPFKNTEWSVLQGLSVGIGASYAKQSSINPNLVTPGQVAIFTSSSSALSDGEHVRLAPEFSWYYHALGLSSEYVRSSQVWRVGKVRSTVTNTAGQVAASYANGQVR